MAIKLPQNVINQNEIVIKKDYAEIILYDKNYKEKARALIDLADVDKCKKYKWHLHNKGYVSTHIYKDNKRTSLLLHNYIIGFKGVDHKNRNKLDCSKENLRKATVLENAQNSNKQKRKCTSKYKGVCFCKRENKWVSHITINKKTKNLGYFDLEITAAQAYNFVAIEKFKEFACLNNV